MAPHMLWLEAGTTLVSSHALGSSCQKPNSTVSLPTGGPSLASLLLLSHLGPAVMTEPGQRHFGNTDAHGSHSSSETNWAPASLRRTVKSPVMATAGRASPSGTLDISSTDVPLAPWLCSLVGRAAHLRPGRRLQACRVVQLLAGSQSVQSMPFPPPPQSSTVHTKDVPSRMQCKQCRREAQLLGRSWGLGRLVPYTSVAMTHSFLSSDIKHTDWYMESLGEHIADIRHSGFSLCNRSGTFSPKLLSL